MTRRRRGDVLLIIMKKKKEILRKCKMLHSCHFIQNPNSNIWMRNKLNQELQNYQEIIGRVSADQSK